jgi:dTMP kinase
MHPAGQGVDIPAQPSGLLIAFEGGEGAGKSSQITLLARALRDRGEAVLVTHEPGATALGKQIRTLLLEQDEPIAARSEALLFAADRAHHVATVIRPALKRGEIVLTDRYVDSSLAYQGAGRTLSLDEVKQLSRWATERLVPDLTVLLDIAPEAGLARVHVRPGQTGPDRLEREALVFHERVRAAFRELAAAEPNRYLVLDASRPVDELAVDVLETTRALIDSRGGVG